MIVVQNTRLAGKKASYERERERERVSLMIKHSSAV